ncbi:MAG: DMT family transporter [Acutalibacteraceae bacterium]|jgi:RarD protein
MRQNRARAAFLAAVLLYGTIGLLLRLIHASSEFVVLCRSVIGTLTIAGVFVVRRRPPDWAALRRNGVLLAISGGCLGLNWVLLFSAYRVTTVAVASLCNYMAPIVVLLLSPLVLGERLTAKKWLCVGVAFAGIVLVSGVIGGAGAGVNVQGVALGLGAAAGFVGVVLCNKRIHGVQPLEKAMAQLFVAALVVLPYVLARDQSELLSIDPRSIALLVMLGVLHTGVAYILYFGGMSRLPVQSVAVLGYLEPVESVLISALVLHEAMGVAGVIGTVMILGAAIWSESMKPAPANVTPTRKKEE